MRHVSFQTGYMGEPVDWLWRDPESFADLLTTYYTDREPESLLVAELEAEVVGYLMGQVMKATGGQANPALASRLLRASLDG